MDLCRPSPRRPHGYSFADAHSAARLDWDGADRAVPAGSTDAPGGGTSAGPADLESDGSGLRVLRLPDQQLWRQRSGSALVHLVGATLAPDHDSGGRSLGAPSLATCAGQRSVARVSWQRRVRARQPVAPLLVVLAVSRGRVGQVPLARSLPGRAPPRRTCISAAAAASCPG